MGPWALSGVFSADSGIAWIARSGPNTKQNVTCWLSIYGRVIVWKNSQGHFQKGVMMGREQCGFGCTHLSILESSQQVGNLFLYMLCTIWWAIYFTDFSDNPLTGNITIASSCWRASSDMEVEELKDPGDCFPQTQVQSLWHNRLLLLARIPESPLSPGLGLSSKRNTSRWNADINRARSSIKCLPLILYEASQYTLKQC